MYVASIKNNNKLIWIKNITNILGNIHFNGDFYVRVNLNAITSYITLTYICGWYWWSVVTEVHYEVSLLDYFAINNFFN